MSETGRFRVDEVVEVLKDPGGHSHHWTIFIGRVEEGRFEAGSHIAVSRIGGGEWIGQLMAFEVGPARRRREGVPTMIDVTTDGTESIGIVMWGIAPPKDGVGRESIIRPVSTEEARRIAADLRGVAAERFEHCADCQAIVRRLAL